MHVLMTLLNMFQQRSGEVVGEASEEYDMLNSFDPRVCLRIVFGPSVLLCCKETLQAFATAEVLAMPWAIVCANRSLVSRSSVQVRSQVLLTVVS